MSPLEEQRAFEREVAYARGRRNGVAATKRAALKKLRRWRDIAKHNPPDDPRLAEYDDIIKELFR